MTSNQTERVQRYLSARLNCSPEDLQQESTVFAANDSQPAPFLELTTLGHGVIVSASSSLLPQLQSLLADKNKDELFECPLIYGQSIYYVPDAPFPTPPPLPAQHQYELLRADQVQTLRGVSDFPHALDVEPDGSLSTRIALCAKDAGQLVGVAAAAQVWDTLWEVGIEVCSACRGGGLAAALVAHLTDLLLQEDILPIYGASVTNIGSQRVALRAGLVPCWVSSYSTVLTGQCPYPTLSPK